MDSVFKSEKRGKLNYYCIVNRASQSGTTEIKIEPNRNLDYYCRRKGNSNDYELCRFDNKDIVKMQKFTKQAIQDFYPIADRISRFLQIMNHYAQDIELEEALLKACAEGNLQQVKVLHRQGALLESKPIYDQQYQQKYPLELACENFAIEVIDYMHQVLQQPKLSWHTVRQNYSIMQCWKQIEEGKAYLQKFQFTSHTTHEQLSKVNNYLDIIPNVATKREELPYYRIIAPSGFSVDSKDLIHKYQKYELGYGYSKLEFSERMIVDMKNFTNQAIQDFYLIANRISCFLKIMNQYTQKDIELEKALLKACAEDNLEQVKVLHQQGALLESKPIYDRQYQSKYPLELACKNFAIEVIDYIHQVLQQPEISWRAVRKNHRIRECWRRIEEGKTYLQKFQFTSHTTHKQLSKVNNYLDIIPNFATKREELLYYRTTAAPNKFYVDSKDSICNCKERGYSSNTVKFSEQAILEMQNFTNQAIQDFCRLADHISRLTRIMNSVIQNAESRAQDQEITKRVRAF